MLEKIAGIEQHYEQLGHDLEEVGGDYQRAAEINKERVDLEPLIKKAAEYRKSLSGLKEAQALLESESDEEMLGLAEMEIEELTPNIEQLENVLKSMLVPKDPRDDKNVIMEIRAGTGGDEAALFAADLFRIYTRYAENRRWKSEILSQNEIGIGGFKEVIFEIKGQGAYSKLKYESGVHRVQRIPETESSGRIHTSTATVAVLAEVEDVDIDIPDTDLRIDVYRASGAGGQHVNRTESAVRITHLPTNIVVQCQNDRSQHKNKAQAMNQLKAKLYEFELQKRRAEASAVEEGKADVGWGSQIRNYVLDQSRIKDLRTGVETGNTQAVLDGGLDNFIEASLKQGL